MSIYETYTDEELTAELAAYRTARREAMMPGGVGVIAGEGRRIEYTRVNAGDLNAEMANLLAEARRRGLIAPSETSGAINVEFGL